MSKDEVILEELGLELVYSKIQENKSNWLDHITRMENPKLRKVPKLQNKRRSMTTETSAKTCKWGRYMSTNRPNS